jgi:SpoVK/Ycf46/Vps4 family AAA+-type ATPase
MTSQKKNLYYLLFVGILIAMVSVAEAAATKAVGEWKLTEVRRANEEPLSITEDGDSYVMKLVPNASDETSLRVSIKVGNSMRTGIKILEEDESSQQQKIEIDFVMGTRMMPGSEEKARLEDYLSQELPKMDSMEVKSDKLLVLSSEAGARIVCEPSVGSDD